MVPEQTLQVQEADEARRGSSGGQRAGEWQGLVCRLPTSATRLESELLLREGLRQQRRLLRPQLHILVSFSAPRSYAAASTHVRLLHEFALTRLLPVSLGPAPPASRSIHPFACPGPGGEGPRGEEGKKGKTKELRRQRVCRLLGAPKGLAQRVSNSWPEPGLGHAVTAEWPQSRRGHWRRSNKTTR